MSVKGKASIAAAAAAVTLGLAAIQSPAATWDGGTAGTGNTWGTASNWVGDVIPTSSENVTFNATDYTGGGGSTWTNGSNVVTLQGANSAIQIGQTAVSQTAGIPGGTTITGIASDFRTLTLSAASTVTGAGNITVLGVGGLIGGPTITLDANRAIDTLGLNHSTVFSLGSTTENAGGRYTLSLTNVARSTATNMTINANVSLVANVTGRSTWRDSGTGTTTVTGVVSSASPIVLNKGGNAGGVVVMNGNNTFTGSVLVDTGTLTFGGSNAYTGTSSASGGTLGLNFNSGLAPNTDIINAGSALVLGGVRGGGILAVTGKTGVTVSQAFASSTIAAGTSSLSITNGNTANTRTLVNLSAIARTAGGTVNFVQPTGTNNTAIGATNGYATSTTNDASGILGPWATVAGTDWAANNGTNIVAYTGYSTVTGATPALSSGATSNLLVNSTSTGDISQDATTVTVNTLRASDAAVRTLAIGMGNTFRLNGILSTGTNGIVLGASGNAGTLTASLADNTAGELILNNSTGVTINAVIANNGSGAVAFTKAGSGSATITSANTYTGGTYVTAGTLSLASGASLTSTGSILLTGGTLNLGGNTQALTGDLTVAGGSLANGTLDKTGGTISGLSGTLSTKVQGTTALLKTSSGTLTYGNTVANTYTGDTMVEEGSLVGSGNNIISVAGNLIVGSAGGGNPASFSYGGSNNVQWNANRNITIYRNGSVNLGGASHMYAGTMTVLGTFTNSQIYGSGTWNIQGGTINGTFFGNSRTVNHTGDVTSVLNAGGGNVSLTLNVADGTQDVDLIFNGGTTGAVNMTKSGAGLSQWTASQNYTGVTNINAGTVRVTNLQNGNVNSNIGAASVAASNLVLGGGTLQYTGIGSTTDRLFTINTTTAGTIDASGAGAVNFNGVGSVAFGTTNQLRTMALTGTSTADNTLSLNVGNNGTSAVGLNKSGAGRWVLSGTNTYTGPTSVTAGTLLVTGTQGASNVTVNGVTAVFGGTGTIAGNTTVTSGRLAPGKDGLGTLTLNGNVTINGTLAIDLDGTTTTADQLLVTGVGKSLDITNATVQFNLLSPIGGEPYVFATYSSLIGTFQPGNIVGLTPHQYVDYNYEGNNQLAVVPEPATAGGLLLGVGSLLIRRRRRSRHEAS